MATGHDPFRDHPELKPVFLLEDDPDNAEYPFSGFQFLGGNVWLSERATAFNANQLRVLARVALDQTDAVMAARLSRHGKKVSPDAVGRVVEALRMQLRAKTREALLPRAIAANVMRIGPHDYAARSKFLVSREELGTISQTARGLSAEEVATVQGLAGRHDVSRLYSDIGTRVGFYGAALMVTAAVVTHQLDPITCELIE